jgi:hypothetical protein
LVIAQSPLPKSTQELVALRASQINVGQLALMSASAVSRMPSVTVWHLYRSQFV